MICARPNLSIVIPVFNEEDNLRRLLDALPLEREDLEVIVVDGGSDDGSISVANGFERVHCLKSIASRGVQLNTGVQQAEGKVIWFLHADSQVSELHIDSIIDVMTASNTLIGGNFNIEFDGRDDFSDWLNRFYTRIRRLGFYYGDSGIFIRFDALDKLGGVPLRALMEDFQLVRLMEKGKQATTCIASPVIVSSSRRFFGRSKWNIIIGWLVIHLMYYLHLPDAWLMSVYDSLRYGQNKKSIH